MASTSSDPSEAYHSGRWEERWSQGTVGWDQSTAHPALAKLVLGPKGDQLGLPRTGKAVVPGCGRGYDIDLFARRGLDTIGVDISPTGTQAAQHWLDSQTRSNGMGKTEVICEDVLQWAQRGDVDKYDLILDYTFLCALPPSVHESWTASISNLASPTAYLITLMYPLFPTLSSPEAAKTPPPWPLTVEKYHELLDRSWEMVDSWAISDEDKRTTGSPGGEAIGVWRYKGGP